MYKKIIIFIINTNKIKNFIYSLYFVINNEKIIKYQQKTTKINNNKQK